MQQCEKDTSSSGSDTQLVTSHDPSSSLLATTNKSTTSLRKPTTFNNDKYTHSLRDFPSSSQFDRNLTVEKATFNPTPPSHLPLASPPPMDTMTNHKDTTDNQAKSTILNNKQTLTVSQSTPASSPSPLVTHNQDAVLAHSSSVSKLPSSAPKRQDPSTLSKLKQSAPAKNESDRRSIKKKRKLPTVNGTATPSEVFHRNLVDAVSNVEDSDEHEQYVYPYRHQLSMTSNNKKKRHQLPTTYRRATAPSPSSASTLTLHLQDPATDATIDPPRSGGFLNELLTHRSMSSFFKHVNRQEDEERGSTYSHRPKLRSHVMDHPRGSLAQEISSSDDGDDDEDDDYGERIYLLRHSPKPQTQCGGISCKIIRNTCFSLLAFILAMMLLTVYQAEPLTDVSASMGHVLASDKELIFDLLIKANNWNWWTVRIQDADLSVFAFSELVPLNGTIFGVDPAEYLGSCQQFDQPLSFASSVMSGQHRANTSTQIRIKSPGADSSGNQRWSRMIRYPFGLVIRGILNYRPSPLFNLSSRQSIPLCVVLHVDPTTLSISQDDDHGYCAHYPSLLFLNLT